MVTISMDDDTYEVLMAMASSSLSKVEKELAYWIELEQSAMPEDVRKRAGLNWETIQTKASPELSSRIREKRRSIPNFADIAIQVLVRQALLGEFIAFRSLISATINAAAERQGDNGDATYVWINGEDIATAAASLVQNKNEGEFDPQLLVAASAKRPRRSIVDTLPDELKQLARLWVQSERENEGQVDWDNIQDCASPALKAILEEKRTSKHFADHPLRLLVQVQERRAFDLLRTRLEKGQTTSVQTVEQQSQQQKEMAGEQRPHQQVSVLELKPEQQQQSLSAAAKAHDDPSPASEPSPTERAPTTSQSIAGPPAKPSTPPLVEPPMPVSNGDGTNSTSHQDSTQSTALLEKPVPTADSGPPQILTKPAPTADSGPPQTLTKPALAVDAIQSTLVEKPAISNNAQVAGAQSLAKAAPTNGDVQVAAGPAARLAAAMSKANNEVSLLSSDEEEQVDKQKPAVAKPMEMSLAAKQKSIEMGKAAAALLNNGDDQNEKMPAVTETKIPISAQSAADVSVKPPPAKKIRRRGKYQRSIGSLPQEMEELAALLARGIDGQGGTDWGYIYENASFELLQILQTGTASGEDQPSVASYVPEEYFQAFTEYLCKEKEALRQEAAGEDDVVVTNGFGHDQSAGSSRNKEYSVAVSAAMNGYSQARAAPSRAPHGMRSSSRLEEGEYKRRSKRRFDGLVSMVKQDLQDYRDDEEVLMQSLFQNYKRR